jgi:MYXO-CTERM domain-containing protein
MSVVVKNIGEGSGVFTIDGVATSTEGTARQGTARTALLDPGAQEQITIVLNVGLGEYEVTMSVRGSSASESGTAVITDSGIPPVPSVPTQAVPNIPSTDEKKDSPGAAVGALLGLALVAAVLRRRTR